jgi:1-acyl-sn-glycerol-3-phosphate acyltransferase
VVRLEEADRPPDWLGKPYACQRGAGAATGEWLLFLDADVTLEPPALRAVVDFAERSGVDAMSLLLQQRCGSFWERVLLPYAYQQFFAGVDAARLARPDTPEALLNGQFILIRRAVYESIGGHGAVRASIAEDVALASTLKRRGYRVQTARGETLGSVRMYHNLSSIGEGFSKNAFAFLADEPWRGVQVAVATTCAGLALPLAALGLVARGRRQVALLGATGCAWAAQAGSFAVWLRRFAAPTWLAPLQPLAAAVFQVIALASAARSLSRQGVSWKGRTYAVPLSAPLPPGVSSLHPRFPWSQVPSLSRSVLRGEGRSLRADSATMVDALRGQWRVEGLEHVPATGPACLVVNHWQRRGLWIGWAGSLLGAMVSQRRPAADPPIHWLATTELRLPLLGRERRLESCDSFLRRAAGIWDMVPLSLETSAAGQRAAALRKLKRHLDAGRVVGILPEGHSGRAGPLSEPLPGVGRVVAWLSRQGVTVIPVAVCEEGRSGGDAESVLVARFGAPLEGPLPDDDLVASETFMRALAALLPTDLRGRWERPRPVQGQPRLWVQRAVPATPAEARWLGSRQGQSRARG